MTVVGREEAAHSLESESVALKSLGLDPLGVELAA